MGNTKILFYARFQSGVHLLWLFPNGEFDSLFSPPTQCFQIASEGQASLLSSRQTGLGVQELYIAPPLEICTHKYMYKCPCWMGHE